MGQTPEELRAGIAGTRADMTATLDAITYRASPRQVGRRQAARVTHRVSGVRDAVMGRMEDVGRAGSDVGSGIADAAGRTPDAVTAQARGNPIAAGLVAFGAGLLAASIVRSTEPEQRAAAELAERAQPLADAATGAAQEVGEHLRGSASEAADHLKETAADAAGTVRDEASGAGRQVGDQARSAAADVAEQARASGS